MQKRVTSWIRPGLLIGLFSMTGLLGFVGVAGGCEKPLFIEQQSRSPYDRYLSLRGRQASMTQQNDYGGQTPALRERLKPLGEQ